MVESTLSVSKLRSHRPSHTTVVAYLALFVALGGSSYAAIKVTSKNVPKDALTGADIKNLTGKDVRNNSLTGKDVKNLTGGDVANGRLLAEDFAPGQLPAGARGPQGQKGDPGPSFGDGRQVPNVANIPCDADTPVGSQTLTVTRPSRIWVHGHGTMTEGSSGAEVYELWLQLRNAANTATLAVSTMATETRPGFNEQVFLSSGGLMLSGEERDSPAPVFVAAPGTYILQLAVYAQGAGCGTTPLPDFGLNQGGAMGYALLGTSP